MNVESRADLEAKDYERNALFSCWQLMYGHALALVDTKADVLLCEQGARVRELPKAKYW